MAFKKDDNVIVEYYGTKYMGVVKSVEGDDADNPTKYYVDFREYWGKNSQGKDSWVPAKKDDPAPCFPSQVSANTKASHAGFV